MRLDAAGPEGFDEDGNRAGRVLAVDLGFVHGGTGDEAVQGAVDAAEVRVVGFGPGVEGGDDGARPQVDDGRLGGVLVRDPEALAVCGQHHVGRELVGKSVDGVDDFALLDIDDVHRWREIVVHIGCLAVRAEQNLARAFGWTLDPPDDPSVQSVDDVHELGAVACDPDCVVVGGEETLMRRAID